MKRSAEKIVKFHAHLRGIQTRIQVPAPPPIPRHVSGADQAVAAAAPNSPAREHESLVGLLQEIKRQLDQTASAHRDSLAEMQELAIELAVAVASHIVKQKLDRNELAMDQLVRAAIEKLGFEETLRVKVNPQDQAELQELSDGNLQTHLEITPDDDLPRGSCVVLGSDGGLLSSLESRLENIRETLLQGIGYARIEPRTAVNPGGSVWGVPDPRKPA